ncbi:MAG TPA: helix-turn-helix transcriptional regulator [Pirellulales bacterium]|jgi:transcriptional regulator with XRE-family HTH domain
MSLLDQNLRRIMVRLDLTVEGVARRSGLDERTVKGILSGGNSKPHAHTLHQLAAGLGVSTDELFQSPATISRRQGDHKTDPVVKQCIRARPKLFAKWADADFDELFRRVGTGGALTAEKAIHAAEAINRHRVLHNKLSRLLETDHAPVVTGILNLLYKQVKIS